METSRSLPVVDLSGHLAGDRDCTLVAAEQVGKALTELGFLSIVGHGVSWSQVSEIYEWAAAYHALPLGVKNSHGMGPSTMGYIPLGGAQQGDLPALNAAFFMGRPGSRRNQFPEPGLLPGFEDAITAYYRAMDQLGHHLLPLYAIAAGMPGEYFDQFFDPALATLRMTHYPATTAAEGQWGIDPHSDAGYMTMLPSNPVAGLEIQEPSGNWFPVDQEPESFVVNAGDMLRRWTNDRFLSTRHRARNDSPGDRYAIPFFFDPRVDSIIDPVPSCIDADNPRRHEPLVYRDYLTTFMQRGYAATRSD
ncbi:MAG: isopenicillin N synthase family dioxygenase [Acidimicrobiales bacterium]